MRKGKFKRHIFRKFCLSNLFEEGTTKLNKDYEQCEREKETRYQSQEELCYE